MECYDVVLSSYIILIYSTKSFIIMRARRENPEAWSASQSRLSTRWLYHTAGLLYAHSVIIRLFPWLCVLLTFFKLLDASIVSRISSLSCAFGYLPSLSFLWSYISPLILCGLWGSCSLSFLYASSSELL